MSALQRQALKNKLPPLPNYNSPGGGPSRFSGSVPKRRQKSFAPVTWDTYFDKFSDVLVGDNSFRVYTAGDTGPAVVLLHGGGFSALSWALFSKSILALCECQIVAIDFRGHGDSYTTDDTNMDADVMAKDIADVLISHFKDMPPIVLVGHSLGGAIAVHIGVQNLLSTLKGLAVIDVVEGTALDALSAMQSFLRGRPQKFETMEKAIEWSVRAGQIRNSESARVSMPGQVKRVKLSEVPVFDKTAHQLPHQPPVIKSGVEVIAEEAEEEISDPKNGTTTEDSSSMEDPEDFVYTWRVDLTKTEPFWEGWFKDMSRLFLSCTAPKLLILAGVDRLDKELTIGQMQGKFQMQVLPNCGHTVHEDQPDLVAEVVAGFLMRQKLTNSKEGFNRHMPAC